MASFDSLRATIRNRWVRRAITLALLGLAGAVAFAQGGVLPVAFGAVVGMVASVAVYRYVRSRSA